MKINSAAFAAIGAASFGSLMDAQAKIENLYAHAAALTIGEDVVRELIAAEQRRAEVSPNPFNWERVKDQLRATAAL